MTDSLTPPPVPDGFEHETPLRAFTDWNETGLYAIGKGLRPSAKHLPVYLDAIERKEGWVLVQMLLDEKGNFRSAIFRRDPVKIVERYREAYPARVGEYFAEDRGQAKTFVTPVFYDRDKAVAEGWRTVYPEGKRHRGDVPVFIDVAERAREEYREQQMLVPADDPVNPKHYGGTACAEIGERLTGNCYQVLKYCWRLGEKDDPKIELGKAIWYAKRELALGPPRSRWGTLPSGMKQAFVIERTEGHPWRREIALLLWDMCYGFGTGPHWNERIHELIAVLENRLAEIEREQPCTTGLAV